MTLSGNNFWESVDRSDGQHACWLWTGHKNDKGYGRIKVGGRDLLAHRLAWILTHGPIPPETPHVLHNCPGADNPACVRHLWLGTHAQNMADMVAKGRQARQYGAQNGRATQTELQVLEIRRVHAEEGLGAHRLARRFGVSPSTITRILSGRTYTIP